MSVREVPALTSPDQVRRDVDQFLGDFFEQRIGQARALHPRYGLLWATMRDIYRAGGKRYRPYVTVLTYQALGGRDYGKILPVAAAMEMLHISLLAIDDIIDRDYKRHGQPNIAGTYVDIYAQALPDEVERRHFADSAAILAETLLLSASHSILGRAPLSVSEADQVRELFDTAIFVVAGGELLDVEAAFVATGELADWETIGLYKTAHYSFVTPLLLGATLAGASESNLARMRELGQAMGMAFQLSDDLLGLFSTEAEVGKPAFSDIEENKLTYLMDRTMALAQPKDKRWLKQLLGSKPVTDADGARVRQIMETSGARAETEARIAQYVTVAEATLEALALASSAQKAFQALIQHVAWRKK